MSPIFVDTGAWYAVQIEDDHQHQAASARLRVLVERRVPLVTTELVIGETWTLLRIRRGLPLARKFLEIVRSSARLQIVPLDAIDVVGAWRWIEKFDDHDFSFVDATSFATMRALGVTEAFAFDRHFRTAGYVLG